MIRYRMHDNRMLYSRSVTQYENPPESEPGRISKFIFVCDYLIQAPEELNRYVLPSMTNVPVTIAPEPLK